MNTTLWILTGIFANMIIGAGVWAAIDDKDHRLYQWYNQCPSIVAWILQPLILSAWLVGLWFWWKRRNKA